MILIIALIGCIYVFTAYSIQKNKIHSLYLPSDQSEVVKRHVEITENTPAQLYNPDYIPVHIYFRESDIYEWRFSGTGTLLAKQPTFMVTAYHVFENKSGQFGYRQISKKELSGKEEMHPIISCNYTGNDDATICTVSPQGKNFPLISSKESQTSFGQFQAQNYSGQIFPNKIHFLTYPEKPLQGLFWIEVKPGTWHIFFKHKVVPGESGTGALIEGFPSDTLLVIIRTTAYNDENFLKQFNVKAGETLGVGHLIKIK